MSPANGDAANGGAYPAIVALDKHYWRNFCFQAHGADHHRGRRFPDVGWLVICLWCTKLAAVGSNPRVTLSSFQSGYTFPYISIASLKLCLALHAAGLAVICDMVGTFRSLQSLLQLARMKHQAKSV